MTIKELYTIKEIILDLIDVEIKDDKPHIKISSNDVVWMAEQAGLIDRSLENLKSYLDYTDESSVIGKMIRSEIARIQGEIT
jgi:hypothetical protein